LQKAWIAGLFRLAFLSVPATANWSSLGKKPRGSIPPDYFKAMEEVAMRPGRQWTFKSASTAVHVRQNAINSGNSNLVKNLRAMP